MYNINMYPFMSLFTGVNSIEDLKKNIFDNHFGIKEDDDLMIV